MNVDSAGAVHSGLLDCSSFGFLLFTSAFPATDGGIKLDVKSQSGVNLAHFYFHSSVPLNFGPGVILIRPGTSRSYVFLLVSMSAMVCKSVFLIRTRPTRHCQIRVPDWSQLPPLEPATKLKT